MRVIAAASLRPEQAVTAGKLRDDLLYRLDVLPIELPPLARPGEDIELLADHFLAQLNAAAGSAKRLPEPARKASPARLAGQTRQSRT